MVWIRPLAQEVPKLLTARRGADRSGERLTLHSPVPCIPSWASPVDRCWSRDFCARQTVPVR